MMLLVGKGTPIALISLSPETYATSCPWVVGWWDDGGDKVREVEVAGSVKDPECEKGLDDDVKKRVHEFCGTELIEGRGAGVGVVCATELVEGRGEGVWVGCATELVEGRGKVCE